MSYPITENLITSKNRPRRALTPQGIVFHSTATPGAPAINIRNFFQNHPKANASAHYAGDWSSIIRMIPENEVAWHAGPTANSKFLSYEMCEPSGYDPIRFAEVYKRAVWFAAMTLKKHGWNVADNVFSHNGIRLMYGETDHTDPYGYFKQYGKTWAGFLNDIKNCPLELPTIARYGIVTATTGLRVRTGPSLQYPDAGPSLPYNTKVKLDRYVDNGVNGKWWSIYYGDHGGYACADYIKLL